MKRLERLLLVFGMLSIVSVILFPIKSDADELINKLRSSYDLLNQKSYDSAQSILEEVLLKDPAHPLALNNLAYTMVAKKDCAKAQVYLDQALQRAKGYKVMTEGLVLVGLCNERIGLITACQPVGPESESMELESTVKKNIKMVQDMMKSF